MTRGAGTHTTVGPRFEVVDRFRPFEPLSPRSVAVREELCASHGVVRSAWSPPAPFVTVEVTSSDGGGVVVAGLSAENGDHLLGFHDCAAGEVGLELRTGRVTRVLARKRVPSRFHRMAFVLCENQPTLLVDRGQGWRPVAIARHRVAMNLDLRVPHTLARFTATWGVREGTACDGRRRGHRLGLGHRDSTSRSGLVRAGVFGMAGLRDLHLVQHADGTPYVRDGRMYLTATCAGLGFFEQAHWGVFAYGPARLSTGGDDHDGRWVLEKTAHLFSRRDGMVLGDHAGQLVRDGERWLLAVSSWGDFAPHRGVHIRRMSTSADLLHGVHVLDTERVRMPTERGCYDPGMTRIDGCWHVSYVESVSHDPSRFHPALAVGPEGSADWAEGLERVGEGSHLDFCEGPVLARPDGPNGAWRLLASDGRARRYRAFDLDMHPVGDLDAPYGTNLPHPQVLDRTDGERVMVTFDGTRYARWALGYGTHGDVLVMRATPGR